MGRARREEVRAGDVVAGRYRVEGLLGHGGFGAVYRAVQLPIGRAVALKMMLPEALSSADGITRFHREAALARHLEHPNTVRLYDFGQTEDGAPFIVWELLKGQPLDAVLRETGGLDVGRVARIGVQALKSLMEAHALGIVHRDVKPSNLFLCEFSGEPDYLKVLDFGIAHTPGSAVTLGGTMLGTPAYMSPEQVSGAPVTPASDLYALGLVLAECLSGAPVFEGKSALTIGLAQMSDAPVPLPAVAVASVLGPALARATQKDPAGRFASAAEMLEAIEQAAPPMGTASLEGRRVLLTSSSPPSVGDVAAAHAATALAPIRVSGPAQARRRASRAAILAALAVAFGAALYGASRAAAPPAPAARVTPPTSRRGRAAASRAPVTARRLNLAVPHLRDRLTALGFRVESETTLDAGTAPQYQFVVTRPDQKGGIVTLWYLRDEEAGRVNEDAMRVNGFHALLRDGGTILFTDLHDGQRLLDDITR